MSKLRNKLDGYGLILFLPILFIITAFITTDIADIKNGMVEIILTRDVLLVDYLEVSNLGATLINASIVSLMAVALLVLTDRELDGMSIASILTILGFSFMGKNVLNVIPIYLGGYVYSKIFKESMKNFVIVLIFGTTLSPFVTEVALYYGLDLRISILLSILAGMFIGFVSIPVSRQVLSFHEGYNLYNLGFTAGIIGIIIASVLRGFGVVMDTQYVVSTQYNDFLKIYLTVICLVFVIYSLIKDKNVLREYKNVIKDTGKSGQDFCLKYGKNMIIFNMGLMGLVSIGYVIISKGTFDGTLAAAIITVMGFSATGKHIKNSIPIMAGVFIAANLGKYDSTASSIVMAALFGTTIAPIAGEYGVIAGLIAGALHVLVGANIMPVHGGLNLYNNGFTGGIVAGFMHAICKNIKQLGEAKSITKNKEAE